jgi:hypothetical protein
MGRCHPTVRTVVFLLASLVIAIHPALGQTSLSSLAKYDVPGLSGINVKDAVNGNDYFHGKIPDLLPSGVDPSLAPTIVGFRTSGADYNIVIIFDSVRLADYVTAFDVFPISDLVLSAPRLTIVPSGNEGSGEAVPSELQGSDFLGASTLDLTTGSTIGATAMLEGELASWLGVDGLGLRSALAYPLGERSLPACSLVRSMLKPFDPPSIFS